MIMIMSMSMSMSIIIVIIIFFIMMCRFVFGGGSFNDSIMMIIVGKGIFESEGQDWSLEYESASFTPHWKTESTERLWW